MKYVKFIEEVVEGELQIKIPQGACFVKVNDLGFFMDPKHMLETREDFLNENKEKWVEVTEEEYTGNYQKT